MHVFFKFGACSMDDQTFLQLANVASKDFVPQEIPSQEYETQDEPLLDMDNESFLHATPKEDVETMLPKSINCCVKHGRK